MRIRVSVSRLFLLNGHNQLGEHLRLFLFCFAVDFFSFEVGGSFFEIFGAAVLMVFFFLAWGGGVFLGCGK